MPQTATFATPGTDNRAGRMFHRASTDISIAATDLEESPTIITRLVADMGGRMTGACDTLGKAYARLRRSLTNCRARMTSVPGWKMRVIVESPGTDVERMVCSQGVPVTTASSLRVTNCST